MIARKKCRFLENGHFSPSRPIARITGIRKLMLKDNLFVFFSGLSMVVTPAKVGEVWKGWLIRDLTGDVLSKTVPVVIVDRITDVLGLMILSLLGIQYFMGSVHLILFLLIISTFMIIALRSKKISRIFKAFLDRRASKYAQNAELLHLTFKKIIEPIGLVGMTIVGAIGWFFECLVFYIVIQGFGEHVDLARSTFLFSFASLAGALSMVPGGLGVAELTISGMLQLTGLSVSSAVGIAIMIRFMTLWYGAILGLSVYLGFKNRIYNGKKSRSIGVAD